MLPRHRGAPATPWAPRQRDSFTGSEPGAFGEPAAVE